MPVGMVSSAGIREFGHPPWLHITTPQPFAVTAHRALSDGCLKRVDQGELRLAAALLGGPCNALAHVMQLGNLTPSRCYSPYDCLQWQAMVVTELLLIPFSLGQDDKGTPRTLSEVGAT